MELRGIRDRAIQTHPFFPVKVYHWGGRFCPPFPVLKQPGGRGVHLDLVSPGRDEPGPGVISSHTPPVNRLDSWNTCALANVQ